MKAYVAPCPLEGGEVVRVLRVRGGKAGLYGVPVELDPVGAGIGEEQSAHIERAPSLAMCVPARTLLGVVPGPVGEGRLCG